MGRDLGRDKGEEWEVAPAVVGSFRQAPSSLTSLPAQEDPLECAFSVTFYTSQWAVNLLLPLTEPEAASGAWALPPLPVSSSRFIMHFGSETNVS